MVTSDIEKAEQEIEKALTEAGLKIQRLVMELIGSAKGKLPREIVVERCSHPALPGIVWDETVLVIWGRNAGKLLRGQRQVMERVPGRSQVLQPVLKSEQVKFRRALSSMAWALKGPDILLAVERELLELGNDAAPNR